MSMDAVFLGHAHRQSRIAQASASNAQEWQRYAKQLEARLREADAGLVAMTALKDVAIAELTKVDPRSYLTVQKNRQAIIDTAYDAAMSGRTAS